jgi:signal recognition particle subunit SRP54
MPGLPGMSAPRKQPAKNKKKSGRGVSGNPAKRNAPQREVAPVVDPAAAFGAGQFDEEAMQKAMAEFQLPPELRGRLGK